MRLVRPTPDLRDAFLEMAADYHAAGDARAGRSLEDFADYLRRCRLEEQGEIDGREAQTTFWLVDEEDRVLGTCCVRHRLNERLWLEGGHIGYDVRPSARGRGCATRMLALALEQARALGHEWVLITVEETNHGSIRVVQKNRGVLIDRVPGTGILRFRIDLVAPFLLDEDSDLPAAEQAGGEGVLAVGGKVTAERVLDAYRRGIFPWPVTDEMPMVWWSPDPRFVLYPKDLHLSKSLEQRVRSGRFEVRLDNDFDGVIRGCVRPEGWITAEILEAYTRLFEEGLAHCVESRRDGELVGGLYGVAIGGVFFGESMFAREPDASKVAFVRLVRQLEKWGFGLVDCQQETEHLSRFGAQGIARGRFLAEIEHLTGLPNRPGPWRFDEAS